MTIFLQSHSLPTDSGSELWAMIARITIFLLALLVFCFVCGYAWRTLPALRKILPPPQRVSPEEKRVTLVAEEYADLDSEENEQPATYLHLSNASADSGEIGLTVKTKENS